MSTGTKCPHCKEAKGFEQIQVNLNGGKEVTIIRCLSCRTMVNCFSGELISDVYWIKSEIEEIKKIIKDETKK